jgi:protein-S-isoprenylcysteine O-methyltransferase Ste14
MNIWQHFSRLAQKEHSAGARLVAMAFESLFFVFGIPAFLFWLAATGSDRWRFESSPVLIVVYLVLAALGLSLGVWTVWVQFRYARGTPVPIMATKKLLTNGPYSLCRNPMALGTFVCYFDVAAATSSFRAVFAVAIFTIVLLAYIKLIEEKEASFRFGDEYVRYKQSTPFIIPRLWRLGRRSRA